MQASCEDGRQFVGILRSLDVVTGSLSLVVHMLLIHIGRIALLLVAQIPPPPPPGSILSAGPMLNIPRPPMREDLHLLPPPPSPGQLIGMPRPERSLSGAAWAWACALGCICVFVRSCVCVCVCVCVCFVRLVPMLVLCVCGCEPRTTVTDAQGRMPLSARDRRSPRRIATELHFAIGPVWFG